MAAVPGTYQLLTSLDPSVTKAVSARRAPAEVQATTLLIGAKSRIFTLTWGQRIEATVMVPARTRIALDAFDERQTLQLLYAANEREQRYAGGPNGAQLVLPKGRYRFVFIGSGEGRLALKKLKPNDAGLFGN